MTRIARMLARWHAVRAYVAALIGRDMSAGRHAMLSQYAERVALLEPSKAA